MLRYEVIAHNTAVASENRIHDDEVARQLGFQGGLVPGVDVYAYLTHPVVEAWGREWLEHGTAEVRFVEPIYDGHPTVAEPTAIDPGSVRVRALDHTGTECAVATFTRLTDCPTPVGRARPLAPRPDHRPDASPEAFADYAETGAVPTLYVTLDPDASSMYLDDVRESLPLYRADEAPAHPAWLLRRANDVLAATVRLGPWIHVGSMIRHYGIVTVGDTVETRSRVVRWWEAKGHRFVTLDVALLVGGDVRTTIDHTAIYEPHSQDL